MSDLAASRTATRWLLVALAAFAVLAAIVAASLVHMGSFDVAADRPHSQPVFWLMNTVRERSVAIRAAGIEMPSDLTDAKRIASGAAQYDEMCGVCHLAPGMKRTEISRGLYPRAPELRRKSELTPAEQFWVVKHGLKMTGMPAWGVTHDDELLWDVVAFLRKLPELNADQYQALVKSAPKTHGEMMQGMEMDGSHGHDHDDEPKQ
ncbi:c-type cytochrome [Methyloceanibacter sp.]|uniref:c-type cytochrome n=1 Tax=Methyloceanibacter sp. TaxID=1965321 RepID=UPI003D6C95F8